MNCSASALLEAREPDEATDFAKEGTLAHAYCARALKTWLGQDHAKEDAEIDELQEYYSPEIMEHVDTYAGNVLGTLQEAREITPDAKLLVEVRLDFSEWIPGGFGTADAVIIADTTMHVFDFKYGKGVKVSAKDNLQMEIYALGALRAFETDYTITDVTMHIVQPRIYNIDAWNVNAQDLLVYGSGVIKPRADLALSGKGAMECGDWCRFCRVRAKCPLLAGTALTTAATAKPELLDPEQVREALDLLPVIKTWVTAFEEYTLNFAVGGGTIPGYKLVEGRSVRTITDPVRLVEILSANGIDPETLYKPKELLTLGGLEKLVGKKRFAELAAEVIKKPAGKPTLVPETDERKAINSDDFAGID